MDRAHPRHPQVDWTTHRRRRTNAKVTVTCPECQRQRRLRAARVAWAIRQRLFTGRCYRDRRCSGPRRGKYRAARGVDYTKTSTARRPGRPDRAVHVLCTCTSCGAQRWELPSRIQAALRSGTHTGLCRVCRPGATARRRSP